MRRRTAAGRRLRRHHAPDPLRAAKGAGAGQEAHRGNQQGRQAQLPSRSGQRTGFRPDVHARRHRGAARLQDYLRLGQTGLDVAQMERADRLARPAAGRHHRRDTRTGRGRRHAPDAHHLARILLLHGAYRRGQGDARLAPGGTERHAGQARRHNDAEDQDQKT